MAWMIRIFILALFIGSNLYLLDTSLTLFNLFFAGLIIGLPIMAIKKGFSENVIKFYFLLFIQLVIYVVYFVWGNSHGLEAVKDLFYSMIFLVLLIWLYWMVKSHGLKVYHVIYKTLFFFLILICAIVIFEMITGLHLPAHSEELKFAFVPTAFFTNPNDLSVAAVMIFAFVFFWAGLRKDRAIQVVSLIITAFIVFVTLSRLSMFVFLIYIISYQFVKLNYIRLLVSASLLLVVLLMSTLLIYNVSDIQVRNPVVQRSLSRVVSVHEFNEQAHSASSANKRLEVWKKILSNPGDYIIGHGWGDHTQFLHREVGVEMNSMHSYLLEMIYNVGILGILPIILFFISMLVIAALLSNNSVIARYAFIHILLLLILTNVPSGVIRFPLIWFVMTLPVTLLLLHPHVNTQQIVKKHNHEQ